jgi:hypothetical protein
VVLLTSNIARDRHRRTACSRECSAVTARAGEIDSTLTSSPGGGSYERVRYGSDPGTNVTRGKE